MIGEINQVLQEEEDKQAKVQAERHRRLEEIEERERRGPLWKNDLMRRFALEECVKWEKYCVAHHEDHEGQARRG